MRWTDSDALRSRDALVVGGEFDGLRVPVNVRRDGRAVYPDLADLSGYEFDAETWTLRLREET